MTLAARHHVIHGRDTTALSHPDASPMNRHSLSPALPDLTYILSHRLYSPLRLLALPFFPLGKHILVARTACQGRGRCKSGRREGRACLPACRRVGMANQTNRCFVVHSVTQSLLFEAQQEEEEGKRGPSCASVTRQFSRPNSSAR